MSRVVIAMLSRCSASGKPLTSRSIAAYSGVEWQKVGQSGCWCPVLGGGKGQKTRAVNKHLLQFQGGAQGGGRLGGRKDGERRRRRGASGGGGPRGAPARGCLTR